VQQVDAGYAHWHSGDFVEREEERADPVEKNHRLFFAEAKRCNAYQIIARR